MGPNAYIFPLNGSPDTDENTLKLKLSVCTLTSESLFDFKSQVLK
jgi:hypothetical protein